jgi:NADH-quinone oxidoreductase subunit A
LGKLLRAHEPTVQKVETYECGEPSIGPGTVQFDLRFYVVALVFLIFEVEVAFFFPPAVIFGQATQYLANSNATTACAEAECATVNSAMANSATAGRVQTTEAAKQSAVSERIVLTPFSASKLALAAMVDLGVFFGVLLVGFAYVWRCGDLDWVRAVRHPRAAAELGPAAIRPWSNDQP